MKEYIAFAIMALSSLSTTAANMASEHSALDLPFKCPHKLYGTSYNPNTGVSTLVWLNPSTGASTAVGTISNVTFVTDIAFTSNVVLYAVGNDTTNADANSLIKINCHTGATTVIGTTGVSGTKTITDLAFDASDNLWAYVSDSNNITTDTAGTINLTTGLFTSAGNTGITDCGNGLAFGGSTLYQAGTSLDTIATINAAATLVSALTFPSGVPQFQNIVSLDYFSGTMYGSLNAETSSSDPTLVNYLVTIDLANGNVSYVSASPTQSSAILSGISFNPFASCDPSVSTNARCLQ